ncbi:Ltp family lipoprotein [Glutamicibacter bergerei]|uniref:Ltp family lipoprotein n=1 Tax=Glutamicibacter bergerei TaxID=256702 RepID=A0ABV9MRH4_9MICC|nr:hypothetical protein [Micrococcaceae bacterium]
MKKLVSLALVGAVAFGLSACSDATAEDSKPATSKEASSDKKAEAKPKKDVPTEHKSALKSAENYSDIMHMSKAALFDQLTSEYGDKFSKDAAQYAIDNIDADWNANALESAKNYQETMAMSPAAIQDQLASKSGDKFTKEQAAYAVKNLD